MTDNMSLHAMYQHVKKITAKEGITGAAKYCSSLVDLGEPELATNALLSITIYCRIHSELIGEMPNVVEVLMDNSHRHAMVSIKQDAQDQGAMLDQLYIEGDLHKLDEGCNIFEESDAEAREMLCSCCQPTFH
jgi:hypothetical protein